MKKTLCILITLYVTSLNIYAMEALTTEAEVEKAASIAKHVNLLILKSALTESGIQENYHSAIELLDRGIDIGGIKPLIVYRTILAKRMLELINEELAIPGDVNKKREFIAKGIIICFDILQLDQENGFRLFQQYIMPKVNQVYSGTTMSEKAGIIQPLFDAFNLIKSDEDFKNIAYSIWQQLFRLKAVATRKAPL